MKRLLILTSFLVMAVATFSQDSTMSDLTKDMNVSNSKKPAVKIFSSDKAINANTTEMVGKGKMLFKITHNFDDIDGKGGVFGRVLGLDNAKDVRIAFHIGLTDHLDLNFSRDKGATTINRLYELALKYQFAEQRENDPTHPVAIALFVNTAVASQKASAFPNFENSFRSFSDRMSQVVQLIIARKFGRISLQLNPTFVHTNYTIINDDPSMFALGGVVRFPISRSMNIVVDYFHPFRSKSSKTFFKTLDNVYNPPTDVIYNPTPFNFYDPLGVGLEINTAGHVFSLNFLNSTEILENRFIPRTISSWTKGKFRWGFTISRKFSLWRDKSK